MLLKTIYYLIMIIIRIKILSKIAKYQLDILNNAEKIKLLGKGNE